MNKPCQWLLNAITLTLLPTAACGQEYDTLPTPPRAAAIPQQATYYLTLVINGRGDDRVVPVLYREGHYTVEAGALTRNHVRLGAQKSGLVVLDTLPQVRTHYDSANQQLHLTVPADWLPRQQISGGGLFDYTPARSTTGLMFNYDAYYLSPVQGNDTLNTWLEQRFFNDYGFLTNTGVYRSDMGNGINEGERAGYLRYDTYWRYSDVQRMLSIQIGDFVSNSLTWSNSARMGGLRISRSFAVRPDVVTYPLLQYSGTTAVPSSVDLFINGYKAGSSALNAGPYTLTNAPYINGAGEATVVTTDALGRQVSTSVPFYVSNKLLRQGLSDFDLSVGALRYNYGVDNGNYANAAFSGFYRYGFNNALTLSTHSELSDGLTLAGAGTDIAIGYWGTLSSAYSQSRSTADNRGTGHQYVLGYSYFSRLFSFSAQHAQRSPHYQDLTSFDRAVQLSRQSDQVTFSIAPFGAGRGTLGLGYFDVQAHDGSRTRLANLSYSLSLWHNSSLYLALNKTLGDGGYNAQAQVIVPLDFGGNIAAGVQRNTDGQLTERLTASRVAPSDGGLGWNVGYSAGGSQYRQADLTWRSPYATLQGGFYGERGSRNKWAEFSGSVVSMDQALFAANKINDAFIVVSTEGYSGVPVRYENRLIGHTDAGGHVLVPWANAYYPAKLEIDTLALPADVETPRVEQKVAVREGSGALVSFPIKRVLAANIRLSDERGQPLPVGSQVTERRSGQTGIVGYDGQVYLSHLQREGELSVRLPDGALCRQVFTLPTAQNTIAQLGPLTCPQLSPIPVENQP